MAIKELRQIQQAEKDRIADEKRSALAAEKDRKEAIKKTEQERSELEAHQADVEKKKNSESKARWQQYYTDTGVLSGLKELQKTKEVRRFKKSGIVISPSGTITLIWGNHFEIKNDKILPEENRWSRTKDWYEEYFSISAYHDHNSHGIDITGTETENVDEKNYNGIQTALAKAFLRPHYTASWSDIEIREEMRKNPGGTPERYRTKPTGQ